MWAVGLNVMCYRIMLAFAKRRKEQRVTRGCLTLASAEVKFEFDSETHENITDVHECAAPRSARTVLHTRARRAY